MARTKRYYDPDGKSQKKVSYDEIFADIHTNFSLPMMIKMNKGSQGKHVYKCDTNEEVETAVRSIFTRDENYDFMALAQEFIEIKEEYRVLIYNNEVQFAYLKDNSEAYFTGNISPLHHEGAKAILLSDPQILEELRHFVAKICTRISLHYNGLDIIRNKEGKLMLIELNGMP